MSRVAAAGKQRDIDAVTGLPIKHKQQEGLIVAKNYIRLTGN
jgi:hypothetical protein